MKSLKRSLMVFGIIVFVALVLSSCSSPLYSGKYYYYRDDIFALFSENEEKFDYIVSVLIKEEISGCHIGVKQNSEKELAFYYYDRNYDEDGSHDGSYHRVYLDMQIDDIKCEQYIREVLVDNGLGEIFCSSDGKDFRFGVGDIKPIVYDKDYGESDAFAPLKEYWFYNTYFDKFQTPQ